MSAEAARLKADHPERNFPDWAWKQIAQKTLASEVSAGVPSYDVGHGHVVSPVQAQAALGATPTAGMRVLAGLLHPATDVLQQAAGERPFSATGALSDVASIASNLVTPEKAGLGAAFLGLKGLKDVKVAEGAAVDVTQAAKDANATKAAYNLAQKHGIPIGDVKGTGRAAQVTKADVLAHRFQLLEPHAQVMEGLKGSRTVYGKEKAARKVEEAARIEAGAKAMAATSNPHEALAAGRAAMRGEYAKIDYNGLKELTPETLDQLMKVAQDHPGLGYHDRLNVMAALKANVEEGRNPRPHELKLIERVFGKKTAAGMVQEHVQNLGDKTLNVLNIPRALQTTADISGQFRQNLVAGVSHPIIWSKSFPLAFKSMTGPGYEASQRFLESRPLYNQAIQDGLRFTDIGEHTEMVAHPEGFQSDIAANAMDKIPRVGGRKVPNVLKGSARAYVASGNYMRMMAYENRMRIALISGDQSIYKPEVRKQIADVLNAATGFGTLPGRADHLLPAMNTFMFSPRLMLARLHYMDPTWYFRLKGPARREAMRGLFALAGSVTGALYLFSRIPGVEVDWQHPQSADWGKLRIGDRRIDIAGGFQQYVRLATELAPAALGGGRTYSTTTGKYTKFGTGFGQQSRLSVGLSFLENKAAPIPGAVINVARGTDQAGNKMSYQSWAGNYLVPLGFQDAYSAFKDTPGGGIKGIEWAAGMGGLSALGLGIQTYKAKPSKARVSGNENNDPFGGGSSSAGGSDYFSGPSASTGSDYFGNP